MSLFSTLFSGINTASSLLNKVLSKRGTRIENKIKAVVVMQKAINNTEAFLVKSKHNYQPNEALSNLWLDAFKEMIKIDKSLAKSLHSKSKFWSNPKKWLQEEGAMELIPTLKELDEKCNQILAELDRRL